MKASTIVFGILMILFGVLIVFVGGVFMFVTMHMYAGKPEMKMQFVVNEVMGVLFLIVGSFLLYFGIRKFAKK